MTKVVDKIIESGNKVDFHIHSIASKHKESDDCVDLSTINNILANYLTKAELTRVTENYPHQGSTKLVTSNGIW